MESSNISAEPAVAETNSHHNDQEMQLLQGESQSRIYECNFCKRGFSNAQALGGHMNIHRKDKEKAKAKKLKHHPLLNPPNHHQQFVIDISSNTLSAPPLDKFKSRNFEDQRAANIMMPANWDFSKEDDSGTATSRNQSNDAQIDSSNYVDDDGFLEAELDLELRLGHEPTQLNTTPMGTRKFF